MALRTRRIVSTPGLDVGVVFDDVLDEAVEVVWRNTGGPAEVRVLRRDTDAVLFERTIPAGHSGRRVLPARFPRAIHRVLTSWSAE